MADQTNNPENQIDPNDPNHTPREQEGLVPNKQAQTPGQPSAFAGMDTGAVVPEGDSMHQEGEVTSRVNHDEEDREMPPQHPDTGAV